MSAVSLMDVAALSNTDMDVSMSTATNTAFVTPSASPSTGSLFTKLSPELEVQVFKDIELFTDQFKLAKLLYGEMGKCNRLSFLVKINRDRLCRNTQIMNYIFGHGFYRGVAATPSLRPSSEQGIENPDRKTYEMLIKDATAQRQMEVVQTLKEARGNHLVTKRESALFGSRDGSRRRDKPSKEQKKTLGIPVSNTETYEQLRSETNATGNSAKVEKIDRAKAYDEGYGPAAIEKYTILESTFSLLVCGSPKFAHTCSGCLSMSNRRSGYQFPGWCDTCLDIYCRDNMFEQAYLRSIAINPDHLMVSYSGVRVDTWLKPISVTSGRYFTKKEVDVLVQTMYDTDYLAFSQSGAVANYNQANLATLKARFRSIANITLEIMAQYEREYAGYPGDPREDLSDLGLSPLFFIKLASFGKLKVRNLEFALSTFKIIADSYDRNLQLARTSPKNFKREVVAIFWDIKLENELRLYTYERLLSEFNIVTVKGWKKWIPVARNRPQLDQLAARLERFVCSGRIAESYATLIYGCAMTDISKLTPQAKSQKLTNFCVMAGVSLRILDSYGEEVVQACIHLLALVRGSPRHFANFLRVIREWLGEDTVYAGVNFRSEDQVDTQWCQNAATAFWKPSAAGSATYNSTPSTLLLNILSWWANKTVYMVLPERYVNDIALLPGLIQTLITFESIAIYTPETIGVPAARTGSIVWSYEGQDAMEVD